MGKRSFHAPRHGSLAYKPRKRAKFIKGRVRNWPQSDWDPKPHFAGFAGFKAGMSHVAYVENLNNHPFEGKEIVGAVTVVDIPPLVLFGVKVYSRDEYGLHSLGMVLAPLKKLKKELGRKIKLPRGWTETREQGTNGGEQSETEVQEIEDQSPDELEENEMIEEQNQVGDIYDHNAKLKELEAMLADDMEIRGVFHTQPYLTSLPRIKPDIIEIPVIGGSSVKERWDYIVERLGNEIRVREVFKEGEYIDVTAVTKGKGFQGPVKIYGIRLLPRKDRKGRRRVGSIGPWRPARTMYTIARAGQLGFHNRTEYHKRIIKISENGDEFNPKGGFIRYGLIKGDALLLLGSVPGPKKRLLRLRKTIRPVRNQKLEAPVINYYNRQSQQRAR